MLWKIHFKNDIKQIIREPIMMLLLVLPLLMIVIFKLILFFLVPFLQQYFVFDLEPYNSYILATIFIMIPGTLGIVTGFMMLDERDGHIAELMSVTPLGRSGYLINRLSFSSFLTIVYVFITYYSFRIYNLNFLTVAYLSVLLAIYSILMGLILFSIADDKVKGLTYAKGLNIMTFFALTDLLSLKWLSNLSSFFPTYWITRIIREPNNIKIYSISLLVYLIWLGIVLFREIK